MKVISGVYSIRHIPTGRRYVGSSKHIYRRFYEHRWLLRTGRHHARYLQNTWKRSVEEDFEFRILKRTKELLKFEDFFINHFKSSDRRYGYNIVPKASSREGYSPTKKTRKLMSEAGKRWAKTPEGVAHYKKMHAASINSPRARKLMVDALLRYNSSAEARRKRRKAALQAWKPGGHLCASSEEMRRRFECTKRFKRKNRR